MTTALDSLPISAENQSRLGEGKVVISRSGNQSHVIRSSATSPLKLLSPRAGQECAWVFSSTYGGGLLGGDSIDLQVEVGDGARCLLSTQASTKIYRTSGPPSRQQLLVHAAAGSVVVSAPDPVVCYGGAWYEQRQRFDLAPDAGLVMLDWLTSGRHARGERWAFLRYDSRTEVSIDGKCVFRDPLVLDPIDGPLNSPMRMGRIDCFATILLLGSPLAAAVGELLGWIAAQPAPGEGVLFSGSPLSGGAVVRVAGTSTEQVGQWIRQRLDFVTDLVGQSPWARKW